MINGAEEIISGVPGQNLDPTLLARSQAREGAGFIMISYSHPRPEGQPGEPSLSGERKYYDILFLKGPVIYDCVRINQDLRFRLGGDNAIKTFRENRDRNDTRISLFSAPDDVIDRFRATFYYEPCLKVHIGALTNRQITALLRTSRCSRGIVECNEFVRPVPEIHLSDIFSFDQLQNYLPSLKRGRLLLYDIEKNKEIIKERFCGSLQAAGDYSECEMGEAEKGVNHPTPSDAGQIQLFDVVPEKISAAMDLSTGLPGKSPDGTGEDTGSISETVNGTNDRFKLPASNRGKAAGDSHPAGKAARIRKSRRRSPVAADRPDQDDRDSGPRAGRMAVTPDSPEGENRPSDYLLLFERLYRSFRQKTFESFGDKFDRVISRAEEKVRLVAPEFDGANLKEETVPSLFDLMEEVINGAPFFKKSKLRQAAATLLSDLYNRHYDLIEQHKGIDALEQVYYRLKK